MKVTFSIDLYDEDGWQYDSGIFLHFGENAIIKFKNYKELEKFIVGYNDYTLKEIRENLGTE